MASLESTFDVATGGKRDLVNITAAVARAVASSGVSTGLVCVAVPHTTCALVLNEDEEGLRRDILHVIEKIVPPLRPSGGFAHDRIDDNAASHLTSILFQPSLTLPVSGGRPSLGTWQSVFLVELDGPRHRNVRVTVVGD